MTIIKTEITVLNRAGHQKAVYTYSPNDTVLQLKRYIHEKTKLKVKRQYLTLGSADAASKTGKVVLDDDTKLLATLPLEANQHTVTVKDLGPQIGWRTVFLIEYGGPLLLFGLNFMIASLTKKSLSDIQKLGTLLVFIHFAKRELETIFVHIFSHGTMPLRNLFKNSAHYWLISGVAISTELFYFWKDPDYSGKTKYTLVALFLLSEFMNFMCHLTLRNLRTSKTKKNDDDTTTTGNRDEAPQNKKRGIPRGWGFDQVSCANYLWEACAWTSFAALVRCWSAYFFLLLSFYQMTVWALKKHRNYKKEFDGKEGRQQYPRGRKAILPFIL